MRKNGPAVKGLVPAPSSASSSRGSSFIYFLLLFLTPFSQKVMTSYELAAHEGYFMLGSISAVFGWAIHRAELMYFQLHFASCTQSFFGIWCAYCLARSLCIFIIAIKLLFFSVQATNRGVRLYTLPQNSYVCILTPFLFFQISIFFFLLELQFFLITIPKFLMLA